MPLIANGLLSGRFQTLIWRLGETVQNLQKSFTGKGLMDLCNKIWGKKEVLEEWMNCLSGFQRMVT